MKKEQTEAAVAALTAVLGAPTHLRDVLDLVMYMLPDANFGMMALANDEQVVIARNIVAPGADRHLDEDYYRQLGEALAWRNATSIVEAVGDGLGRAMHEEFCGDAVPVESGDEDEPPTIGDRVARQISYDSRHITDRLEEVLGDIARENEDDIRIPE